MSDLSDAPMAFLMSLDRSDKKKNTNLRRAESKAASEFGGWLKGRLRRHVHESDLDDIVQLVKEMLVKSAPWSSEEIKGSGSAFVLRIAHRVISDYSPSRSPLRVPRKRPSKSVRKKQSGKTAKPFVAVPVKLEDESGEVISELGLDCPEQRRVEDLQALEAIMRQLPEKERETAAWEAERAFNGETREEQARRVGCTEKELDARIKALRRTRHIARELLREQFEEEMAFRKQKKVRGSK